MTLVLRVDVVVTTEGVVGFPVWLVDRLLFEPHHFLTLHPSTSEI